MIQQILAHSRRAESPVVFLPGYEMELAAKLVAGSDLWLNTPLPPFEASGTSGMKAALNGVLNLSTLDGWWVEACEEDHSDGQSTIITASPRTARIHRLSTTSWSILFFRSIIRIKSLDLDDEAGDQQDWIAVQYPAHDATLRIRSVSSLGAERLAEGHRGQSTRIRVA